MTHYLFFDTPGHIPGVPGGPFAWCRADVAEDGSVTFSPLALLQAEPSGEALPIEEKEGDLPPSPVEETGAASKRKQKGE